MPTLKQLVEATNVCDLLNNQKIDEIGRYALDGYKADDESRAEWKTRTAEAMKLALQTVEPKSIPWQGCANVKFPLVTVAAMQYAARAYPSLISGNDLVQAKVYGQDPDGSKTELARRVSQHMTWQNLEQDTGWEEEHDRALLVQAIVGDAFIKRTYEPGHSQQVARLVLPENFVINYYARDIPGARRYTERFYLNVNNIRQRILDGRFRDTEPKVDVQPTSNSEQTSPLTVAKDERQGLHPPPEDSATPYLTCEQYCWLDLDDDGYEEPYIVTFHEDSGYVYRIVARFLPSGVVNRQGKTLASPEEWKKDPTVYKINPVDIYTKIPFVPSPDGGFYDLGLGTLAGPINESVNTALNQCFDAGTMATLGGGFFGRGFKSKGGPFTFQPNEWKPVDAPGDDLRKNVMPLPVRDPPQILFQLIGFLVNYGERIVSSTELQVGENVGQNTPAETARTMNENGQRVYSAIYKRTWRALRTEFRIQAKLNALFLDTEADYPELERANFIRSEDYRALGLMVKPAADPHVVSETMRIQQAQMLVQNAFQLPGHNKYQALLRLYRSMQIPNIEQILPPPMQPGQPGQQPQPAQDFAPTPNPKMIEAQIKGQELQLKQQQFALDKQEFAIQIQLEIQESAAKVNELNAKAIQLTAQAKNAETEPLIKLIYAEIEAEGKRKDRLVKLFDIVASRKEQGNGADGRPRMAGMEATPANAGVPQATDGAIRVGGTPLVQ